MGLLAEVHREDCAAISSACYVVGVLVLLRQHL
jgi:hypothetical protein